MNMLMGSVKLQKMNRCKFISVLVFGLIILGFVSGATINEEVLEAFEGGNEKARVIVKVSEPEGFFAQSFAKISQKKSIDENKIKRKLGDIMSVEMSLEELKELENVEILGIDRMVHAFLQDARGIVGAESSWELNISGVSINGSQTAVCVIDTGVDTTHPDLYSKVIAQYCFCSAYEDGTKNCCPDGTNQDDDNATDNAGHGTHVSGIIAASGGIDGVARGANIVAVKVLNSSGSGYSSDVAAAIEWCANDVQVNEYNISVISLSLGYGQYTNSVDCVSDDRDDRTSAINAAVAKNISVVIATGNTNGDVAAGISSPACLYNTTKVTASDKDDKYANYALRHANFPDILVAPGGSANNPIDGINSTLMGGGYIGYMGTSMATPMVAGAIALMNQYLKLSGQTKTPSEVKSVLNDTGVILDDSAGSGYNFSRIDVYSAILSLDIDVPNVTLISPTNNKVNLSVNQTFVCNATDWQLANATLKVWNSSGELYYNATNNFTGTINQTSFDLDNMSLGTYYWNCLVSDAEGNLGNASNYTLTIGGIFVNLISPSDDTYTNINENNFTCNLTSEEIYELSNITFYLWNSSVLVKNETRNVSGITNATTFNFTFTEEEDYSWNCMGINNDSYNSSAENNFTITFDVTNPIINLSEVAPGTSTTIVFSFNVSDLNPISNCSVYVDNVGTLNTNIINNSGANLISVSGLSAIAHNAYVNCSDGAGNTGNSSTISSIINSPPVVPTSSGEVEAEVVP